MVEIHTAVAKQEPGYANIWRLESSCGHVIADMRIRPDAGDLAKRLADGLNAQNSRSYAPLNGRVHDLKIDSHIFEEVHAGRKLFEVRMDDKGYQCGDQLRLRETLSTSEPISVRAPLEFTGREVWRRVVGILRGGQYGIANGWVVMSIVPVAHDIAPTGAVEGEHCPSEPGALQSHSDRLGALLSRAMTAMKELQLGLAPDESQEGVLAIVPPQVLQAFLEAIASLRHDISAMSVAPPPGHV